MSVPPMSVHLCAAEVLLALCYVAAAVRRLKRWRPADPDGVCAEYVQALHNGSGAFAEQLHALVETAVTVGMLAVVKQSELLPL